MEDPYPVENIDRLGVLMFQTSDNSQLLRRVLWINAELTIVSSLKHKNTQPIYIFNRENPQNSEPQNGPKRGLDFIALTFFKGLTAYILDIWWFILISISRWYSRRNKNEDEGVRIKAPDLRTGHIGSRLRSPSGRVRWDKICLYLGQHSTP